MLRPQVFALQSGGENSPSIGFAASEKQAIDAALESLSREDQRFWPKADHYWNARGGSHTDGGAFIFSVEAVNDNPTLVCRDKFGQVVRVDDKTKPSNPHFITKQSQTIRQKQLPDLNGSELLTWFTKRIREWNYLDLHSHLTTLSEDIRDDTQRTRAIKTLTQLLDRRYPTGDLRRSSLVAFIEQALNSVFEGIQIDPSAGYEFATGHSILPEPMNDTQRVVVDASSFDIEGEASLSRALVELAQRGFSHFILANTKGHRFIGNGFGPNSKGIRIDVYGSSGDYLASGLDGMEIYVHGSGQDQLAQIMKSGKLVVHGDVGQTFGYAAKGGQAYILGNAAGRPMINAVGKPRIVINGTCLDYLAESFMAGDPFNGGGFVILNGVRMKDDGDIIELEEPYPGGNLFSLASGGAIYIRDPEKKIHQNQLNGGELSPITHKEWLLIKPYLEENSRQFGISIKKLLNGESPERVYRVIRPKRKQELLAEEAWIKEQS
jgi:glutamate synthase domain-containing protein 3